jgi:signal transduction histidine kinase
MLRSVERRYALTVLVVVSGFAATGLAYGALRQNQRESAQAAMDQRTAVALAAVRTETERYRGLIEATAAGIAIDDELSWEDFDAATSPLDSAGLNGASSVAYVVPARTAEIPAVQARWRERGAEGLVLKPAAGHGEHYFSIFTRLLDTAGPPLDGLDMSASAEATEALEGSRSSGQPSVSDTYVLLRDRNLPAGRQQPSFVFAAPLWTRANQPEFRGWVVLGLRSQDFLTGVLATVGQGQLDGELLATGRDGGRPSVAGYEVTGHPDLARRNNFPVADRQWTLVTGAESGRLQGGRSGLPLTVLIGGSVMTLMLAGLVHSLVTARRRALLRVRKATADLRAAEAESRRQAGLLGAVMTSIGDAVGVVDENGTFLLHNPAARDLLGLGFDVDDPDRWQEHYGLYLPDGRTPFPVDQLPLIRALRGESSDRVEMIIRNEARPEGLLISVDGRPLDPSAGQKGAVAVFHDITELRRYENDLAVFAGVVAHDLKAPLTVMLAHCEAAAEDLSETAPAQASLTRIARAVERMSGMIDTLLAYTTARDAPLRVRDVELGALVAEVVSDRIAHLPPAEQPDVYVGPLPCVRADPEMLRHVLENLLGNAVKYVRPGELARVDVTAGPASAGWTRIEVADRGIGIPDEDKPDVFERFHRAPTAAGYAGTGLGLAICRRIVERHGGETGVADNPGGGTRFHITLPEGVRNPLEIALSERAAVQELALREPAPEPDPSRAAFD